MPVGVTWVAFIVAVMVQARCGVPYHNHNHSRHKSNLRGQRGKGRGWRWREDGQGTGKAEEGTEAKCAVNRTNLRLLQLPIERFLCVHTR